MTIYDLANLLHTRLCKSTHDEYSPFCKYERENLYTNKWEHTHHKKYLVSAMRIADTSGLELEDIMRVIDAL